MFAATEETTTYHWSSADAKLQIPKTKKENAIGYFRVIGFEQQQSEWFALWHPLNIGTVTKRVFLGVAYHHVRESKKRVVASDKIE
jgi:hypothetical protein